MDELDETVLARVQAARQEFLARLDPVRADLHRYCRKLTGDVWDAEDLVQETLTRALARAAQTFTPVRDPRAWLFRIATNAYVDWWRRPAPVPVEVPERTQPAGIDPLEVRDALREMHRLLPPRERAAVVLADAFGMPNVEIAGMLGTTVGAVKAALHRGRGRLADPARRAADRPAPDRSLVDALAEAFGAYDLERVAALFLADGVSEIVGQVREDGRERALAGTLHATLVGETRVRFRPEVRVLEGEPVVLLWEAAADGSMPEAVGNVLRVQERDARVARLRWYFFCPETVAEVAGRFELSSRTHGYHGPGCAAHFS
jgi:RNA polymerase sigma-70 factor, ECF subfamily